MTFDVKETWRGRRASTTDDPAAAVYTRVFRVITDDPKAEANAVLKANGIPALGDYYFGLQANTTDPNVQCFNLVPENSADDARFWYVRAEYTSNTIYYAAQQGPEVSWETEFRPRAQLLAYSGTYFQRVTGQAVPDGLFFTSDSNPDALTVPLPTVPVRNTAGDPFDPAPEVPRALKKLIYTRAEPSFDINWARYYERTVNYDTFWGRPAGECLMLSISGQIQNPYGFVQKYWRVRYEILFDEEGHSLKLLNAGYRYKNGSVLQQARDTDNTPFARPSLLDNNGAVLATNVNEYYGVFTPYRAVPWAPLNIQRVF